jgi:DNA-binding CsgD family transcriptional regulator
MGGWLITPLTKKTLSGKTYERDPKVEALLVELFSLSRDQMLARAAITRRNDPGYVPSECLVFLIRASRSDNSDAWFERLYKLLAERVLRCLPRLESADGKTESLTRGKIRDKVFGRFVELLAADRTEPATKLDYFEVRFDGALASLRRDAQEQAWREENRSEALEFDGETGELSPEVERAVGHIDPFAGPEIDGANYRSRLDAAIEALPPEQIRIVDMLRQGFPIDSKASGTMTIAKALGRSEKTIRAHRDKAFATLRAALLGEDGR